MTRRTSATLAVLFTLLLAVMAGHESEHAAQIVQKDALAAPCPNDCRGLLGYVFDLEWVHFLYNTSIELALVGLILGFRLWREPLLLGAAALQAYHVVEHTEKLAQWFANGRHSPSSCSSSAATCRSGSTAGSGSCVRRAGSFSRSASSRWRWSPAPGDTSGGRRRSSSRPECTGDRCSWTGPFGSSPRPGGSPSATRRAYGWRRKTSISHGATPNSSDAGSWPKSAQEPDGPYSTAMAVLTLSVPQRLLPAYQR